MERAQRRPLNLQHQHRPQERSSLDCRARSSVVPVQCPSPVCRYHLTPTVAPRRYPIPVRPQDDGQLELVSSPLVALFSPRHPSPPTNRYTSRSPKQLQRTLKKPKQHFLLSAGVLDGPSPVGSPLSTASLGAPILALVIPSTQWGELLRELELGSRNWPAERV